MPGISAIGIDCGMSESFGNRIMGRDEEMFPVIITADIACGFHAGDPTAVRPTSRTADQHGVAVGAHPGHRGLEGFGRHRILLGPDEAGALFTCRTARCAHSWTRRACPMHDVSHDHDGSHDDDGTLLIKRKSTGTEMNFALGQVRQFLKSGQAHIEAGILVDMMAGGIGVHGDGDRAVELPAAVRQTAVDAGVPVEAVAA